MLPVLDPLDLIGGRHLILLLFLEELKFIERFKPFDPIGRFRVAVLVTVKDVLETRGIELCRS